VRLPDGSQAPAGSEVAFAAVDEALLELQPNASWNLLREMFPDYGYRGEIATSQQQVVGKRHYGRKALPPGGGGGKAPTRQLLDTLLTWQPAVKLDARGEAMVDIPVNDVLSRFRLVAVADVGEQLFGAGEASFEVAQDVQLVSGLSPLTREGDAMTAAVTVRNGSKRPLTLTVSASRDSQTLPAQRLTLAAGDARQLSWAVTTPAGVSVQQWLFAARAEDGSASDRLSLRQRVEPAVPVSVWQGAFIRLEGEQSLPVALPAGALPGQGGVRVSVQSRLAGELPGVARWLEDYPFSCLEQRAAVALGRRDAAAWAKLQEDLPGYLDEHGLADYFPRSSANGPSGSDVLTSHLLSVSHEAGQPLPDALRERMLAGLSAFVEGRIKRELPGGAAGLDARRLAAMMAGEHIAAGWPIGAAARKIIRQAVLVQITGQVFLQLGPGGSIAATQRHGGALFQAAERVVLQPARHTGQLTCQPRLHADAYATLARQGAGRQRHRQRLLALQPNKRPLPDANRHGRLDTLAQAQPVAGRAIFRAGGKQPLLDADAGRGRHRPTQLASVAGSQGQPLGRQGLTVAAGADRQRQRALAAIAHRHRRRHGIAFTRQRRQTRHQLHILRHLKTGLAGAKQLLADIGHRHQPKAAEHVIHRNVHHGFAARIQLDRRLPGQQGIQQLTGGRLAAATAWRQRLATVMALAHHLLLAGGDFATVAIVGKHLAQQVPTGIGLQFQQGFVHGGKSHFTAGRRLAAIGQAHLRPPPERDGDPGARALWGAPDRTGGGRGRPRESGQCRT
jgi:hypothetical protein